MIKNGTRLQSQVCDTQVIVVKAADSLDDLRCGGRPMVPLDADGRPMPRPIRPSPTAARWASATSTTAAPRCWSPRPAPGSLSVGATPLTLKEAKPLPASD